MKPDTLENKIKQVIIDFTHPSSDIDIDEAVELIKQQAKKEMLEIIRRERDKLYKIAGTGKAVIILNKVIANISEEKYK